MLRIFRVADATKHCGVNTKLACIILGIIVTATEIYSYLFLPFIVGIILIAVASVFFLVLLAGAMKMRAGLVTTFLIINIFLKIPVFVTIYYISYTLASYDNSFYYYGSCGYQCSLYTLSSGFLWSGLIVSFLCCVFDGILTGGLRKLRLLSQGINTVVLAREDHQHYHHPQRVVVATPPQQVVYTTTGNVVYPATTVYTTPVYPSAQPYMQQQAAQPYIQQQASQPYMQQQAFMAQSQEPMASASHPPPEYKP